MSKNVSQGSGGARASAGIELRSLKNQAVIADKCHVAECFYDRLRGLIGKAGLEPGQGMLFPKNNSIHMWFMRFPIDVVFLLKKQDENGRVVFVVSSVHESVRPWRLLPLTDWRASETLELPEGTIRKCALHVGDELCSS
jgi:uncharacterized membrane protein (UPF0127 family)